MSRPRQRGHRSSPGLISISVRTSTKRVYQTRAAVVRKGVSLLGVRSFFLFLSRRKLLRRWMETSPLAQRFATRFVAGETWSRPSPSAADLNARGHHRHASTTWAKASPPWRRPPPRATCILRTLSAIHDSGIQGNVSLKLTQFGLDLSDERVPRQRRAAGRTRRRTRAASSASTWNPASIRRPHARSGHRTARRYGAVGVVIQAYLYRSREDVEELCAARHPRAALQGRLPGARRRGLPAQGRGGRAITSS